jgi:multidrug efflux pump subunit AcrA (membrane-fusion protein)
MLILLSAASCGENKQPAEESGDLAFVHSLTPVTITSISEAPLSEYEELSATSQFMQKNYVKANVNGYIERINAALGKYVNPGEWLFTIRTREAQSIGNAINQLDSSFRFSGVSRISASRQGYVSILSHQVGDYVQDGEQLAVINDAQSFAFILNLPYALRPFLLQQKTVQLYLADNTVLTGAIERVIQSVDPMSQTQQVVIKVQSAQAIPENLIARVRVLKMLSNSAQSLPRAALLSDESQSEFWVMKMINDSTAVKVTVECGVQTKDMVEIKHPQFGSNDRILLTGNYGLPDTAGVVIEAKEVKP